MSIPAYACQCGKTLTLTAGKILPCCKAREAQRKYYTHFCECGEKATKLIWDNELEPDDDGSDAAVCDGCFDEIKANAGANLDYMDIADSYYVNGPPEHWIIREDAL